jgi:uncharacterized protein YhjY with autotransporter beta-barrel domain
MMRIRRAGILQWAAVPALALLGFLGLAPAVHAQPTPQYTAFCFGCHSATPSGARLNAGNASAVISAANSNHGMGLSAAALAQIGTIATEIGQFLSGPQSVSVNYQSSGNSIVIADLFIDNPGAVVTTTGTVTSPARGTLTTGNPGSVSVTYNHTASNCISDSFVVQGTGSANTANRAVNIAINPPSAPNAADATFNIAYSTGATTLDVNPFVGGTAPAANMTVGALSPNVGSRAVTGPQTFTYSASASAYATQITTTYNVTGPCATNSATRNVTINVGPPPAPSVVAPPTQTVPAASPTIINLNAFITGIQDTTPAAAPGTYVLTASQPTAPSSGSTSVSGNSVTYTPPGTFAGVTTFTFSRSGPGGTSNIATVTMNVTAAPIVTGTSVTTAFNTPITVNLAPFITGSVTSVTPSGAVGGTAIASGPTSIQFTPALNFIGAASFNYTATGPGGTSTQATVNITVNPPPPVITSPNTAAGTGGQPFSYQITASNAPTSFGVTGALPAGVTVNAGGLISGTPTQTGAFPVTITATNAGGTGSQPLAINIALLAPVITSPASTSGAVGQPFVYQITASNLPATFAATGLPPGLAIDTTTGAISGTPTTAGTFTVTVSATNAAGTGVRTVAVAIVLLPPSITSVASVSGTAGQPFSYQITANSNPTSFSATGLPPGLRVDTSTGLISGTPAVGGQFNVTVGASNAAGTVTRVISIAIGFAALTAKDLSVSVPFNTATTIDFPVTGQVTQINIVAAPAHGTVPTPAPNATSAIYTPAKGYSGEDRFTYSATGPAGTSAVATVSIAVGTLKPVAGAVTMTVPLNTPTTLDLAPFLTGSSLTGVAVLTDAAHGIVEVSGTKVTYSPKNNFFGSDAFSYYAFGNAGKSAPATVTVIVVGRPDPSKDTNVTALVGAQSQVARRFSRAQIANYQSRMESLHVGPDARDEAKTASGAGDSPKAVAAPAAGRAPAASADAGADVGMAYGAHEAQPNANWLVRTGGEPANSAPKAAAASAPGLLPASFVTSIIGAAQTGTVNLANSTDRGDASAGFAKGLGLWIGGSANFGTRDSTQDSTGSRFSTDGISVGGDRRLSNKLVLGMGVGYAQDKTRFGSDGTQMKSDGSSIAAYASYQPSRSTFIDALLGYGTLNLDSDRYVSSVDEFAIARRKGNQVFGSVAAGVEYRGAEVLLSPYGRLDFAFDKLKEVSESGAGLNALTYQDQTQRTFQLSLGLRAESQHETDFGMVRPRLRVEYRHDFESGREATIAYADQFAGLTYSVTPSGTKRNFLLLGIGSDFIFRSGLRLGIDYQGQRSGGPDSSQAIRFLLSQELDGRGFPNLSWSSQPLVDPVRVEAGFSFDDNVSRGREAGEIFSDKTFSLNLGTGRTYPINDNTRVIATALLNGEKFHTYTGLGRLSGGLQGELQYRGSADFDAVTFAAFARGWLDAYESRLRDGERYSIGVSARRALTDRIDVYGELSGNGRRARSAVFDLADYCARLNLDYSLGRRGAFYLGGEFHRGDTVSSGRVSLVNGTIADVFVLDDAFPGGEIFAYRFDAKTWAGTLGYNFPLGPRDSIDFSWRRVQSTPTQRPGFDAPGSLRYIDNLYSIVYLMRF